MAYQNSYHLLKPKYRMVEPLCKVGIFRDTQNIYFTDFKIK